MLKATHPVWNNTPMKPKGFFLYLIYSTLFIFLFIPFSFAETASSQEYSEDEIEAFNQYVQKIIESSKVPAMESRNEGAPEAPLNQKTLVVKPLSETGEEYSSEPESAPKDPAKEKKGASMGMVRTWGRYRLAAGSNGEDFIFNDANSALAIQTLQGPQSDYIFGERRENTYDPGIYNQYQLNVEFSPEKKWDFYTQIVIDPWSWVGTTGDQTTRNNQNPSTTLDYNLKYFGAFNSTIREVYRNSTADRVAFPYIKAHQGHLTSGTVVQGLDDNDGIPGNDAGLSYNIPEHNIDTELRPFRKMWIDYKEDNWHARVFALADENQALTTDDPLRLSNNKDYWQASPWLYQYRPVQYFADHSIKRGYYSDALSYYARDSEGNRLVLLRGASMEAATDDNYFVATVAAPYTPWDEKFDAADNVVGAIRFKNRANEKMTNAATFTFREGLVDNSVADSDHVLGIDTKYAVTENVNFLGEVAVSHRELDLLTTQGTRTSRDGFAYKAELVGDYDHKDNDGHSQWLLSYAQMDATFDPLNSSYLSTRDDRFWGTHIRFDNRPDLESFKLGDGLDVNRMVVRFHWKEKLFKDRFYNEFDVRNVHKAINTAYVETVTRDEITLKINPSVTAKGLFRWRALPRTTADVDPVFTGFYFPKDDIDLTDFVVRNTAVRADQNADQFTLSGALQYVVNSRLTVEGIYERTNAIPDFPRGLLNDFFRDPVERVDGILIDRMQNFMYFQGGVLGGSVPYQYYNIFKERLIFKPESRITCTLHAAQNGYRAAGGIDDNVNHVGLGMEFVQTKKLSWFCDFTYSRQIDIPRYAASNETEVSYDGHENFYASLDYKLNATSVLRGEYGVFGFSPYLAGNPYNAGVFSLPTIDTEHLFRVSLTGEF